MSAGPPARWVEVASFAAEGEARLLAGRLDAEGIEARLFPEFQGGYYGEGFNLPVWVLVPEHRMVEAMLVVQQLERT